MCSEIWERPAHKCSGGNASAEYLGSGWRTIWEYGPVMNRTRIYAYTAALDDGRPDRFSGRESDLFRATTRMSSTMNPTVSQPFEMNYPRDLSAVVKMNDGRFFLAGGSYDYGIAPGYQDGV